MKQRVVVQAIIKSDDKILLLRRCQGGAVLIGKYELPGGALNRDEQPEDAMKRHLKAEVGLLAKTTKPLDVIAMTNREQRDMQFIFVVYDASGLSVDTPVTLGNSYDKYEWKKPSEIQRYDLRDSTQMILGLYDTTTASRTPGSQFIGEKDIDKPSLRTFIFSDGGSRGNPGPSAAAFIIFSGNKQNVLSQGGAYLGVTTNNQAEYHGVRLGLERALELGVKNIEFCIDSLLVVNQLNGMYKIKNRELWPINERIHTLIIKFDRVIFTHVPREQNQQADLLVNKILDEHQNNLITV